MTTYSSSSSSSTRLSQGYDVFMSFRGEDTRTGFTSHLYKALTRKHIRTYKDDTSLEIGNFIAPELLEAIEASRFAVVILSSTFATSKWCLEEITKVVDCLERGTLIVIPVFYHVSPSDVRHQSGSFKQGFASHEANPEITPQKVETWRAAFARVGDISGLHVTSHRNESETVSEIVRKILKDMQVTLPTPFTDGLVGIDSRVHEVKRILIMESSDVRFIGICGMSGMGKTTLAEVVYKGIQNNFQGSCFIENIKDVSKKNDSTNLCKLQEKLLDDILKNNIHVESVTQGQTLLGTKLRGLRVIIVLDDVNHVDQLTFLAGSREWFGPGSRILVTTTNNDLLDSHIVDDIYTSEEMNGDEALRLFSQSAFKKEHPTHGYEKLSDDIVKFAGGLPLALNVYGSVLCGKEENYWKDMLEKLREYAHEEVLGRLETVYARLDRIQRNSFIYIACFLKGRDINLVKDILTNLRLYPECGISDLINKFLITINHDDTVWVHDLLQQMCWEVLRKESERHDGKHKAIKFRQNVEDIFSLEPEGTRSIEIINQEPYEVEGTDFFDDHNCFSKMIKLKFLRISKIGFHQGLHRLSNELRILEWYGCSLKSLPTTFKPQHIFELEMCYSQLETLWEKALDLPNLRSINLSFSKYLIKIPDLTSTSNLVKLNLEGCTNLTELHESVLLQKRVRYMNLKGCTRLRNLGTCTMEMEALEVLLLSGCSNLEYLPEFGQNMRRLEHLFVDGTSIKKLSENLVNMFKLRKLDVSETAIKEIPLSVHYLERLRLLRAHRCPLSPPNRGFPFTNVNMLSSGLRELDLSYCNLSEVPDGICLLHRLINLDLSGNDFVYLPASISLLSNLRMLCLNNCERLESLPKLSVVNEDTLNGHQIRFNYYISREGVDVSKFDVTGSNTGPMVSCLNCPKLVENGSGSCLTERILNSYLQLRAKYWITPEAVFEIVDAGSKIPSGFKLIKSDENVLLEGPWVGVAICAVINARQTVAYMESKYVITVYIHVEGKCWPISVPINLLLAGLENHLVFYWTVPDDLHRLVDSKQRNFSCSFSVQPGDGNLLVTKFGVRFIRDEEILQLKRPKFSTIRELHSLIHATVSLPTNLQWYIHACEADTDLRSCHSIIHDLPSWMMQFILDHGKQQDSLDGVHKILKCLIEINQQVLSERIEELKDSQLFPLVYDFNRIYHGTSQLYNDFVRLLKDESYTWMSVKLALEQVVLKSRSDDYIYKETLQQLNDLEAADGVRFSDDFITSFAYMCRQTVAFSRHFSKEIQDNKKFKLVMTLAKVSSITIACVFIIVATYIGDYKLLQEMKDIDSYSMWLYIIQRFTRKSYSDTYMMSNSDWWCRLRISDFYGNAILLQDLKKKMAKSISITKENEGDVMAVIGKLETKIDKFSKTIENMSHQAYKYSHDIREVRITLNQIIADNNLHIRFCLIPGKDILQWKRHEDSKSKSSRSGGGRTTFNHLPVMRVHPSVPGVLPCSLLEFNDKSGN